MPRQLKESTRRRILDAATRLFGTRGYDDTSIAQIATELGMGYGTFYRYFSNKRDILDHVIDEALDKVGSVSHGRDPSSPTTIAEHAEQVDEIGRALFAAFIEDAPAARVVFYEAPGVDQATRDRLAEAFDGFAAFTAEYLKNGKKRGYLRTHFDEAATASALTAIVFEGIRHTLRADDPDAEARKWVSTYQLLASGLAV